NKRLSLSSPAYQRLPKKDHKTKALTPSATRCFSSIFTTTWGLLRMNPRMKTLAISVAQVFGVGFAMTMMSGPASAQQQTAQTRERIEVTGSNIKRIEGETALPVTVINRQDIEKTGATTAAELLNTLSAVSAGGYSLSQGLGEAGRPGNTS